MKTKTKIKFNKIEQVLLKSFNDNLERIINAWKRTDYKRFDEYLLATCEEKYEKKGLLKNTVCKNYKTMIKKVINLWENLDNGITLEKTLLNVKYGNKT